VPVYALTNLLVHDRERFPDGIAKPGDELPETVTFAGRVRPLDLDRLVADGLAERRDPKPAPKPRKKAAA
jgi:hypothetical protein